MTKLLQSLGILITGLVVLTCVPGVVLLLFATLVRFPEPGWILAAAGVAILISVGALSFVAFQKLCRSARR